MKKRFGVAILGGSGYGAGELLRMLLQHPDIEVCQVATRSHSGKPVASVHTHLDGMTNLKFVDSLPDGWWSEYSGCAVVCSMPPGQAGAAIAELLSNGLPEAVRIIDLSGDFRLRDPETHARYYHEVAFQPEIREHCVYGLPEINRSLIPHARFISNPGCLSTTAILALAPISSIPLTSPVVVDAKTGTSGAGREPQASMHHPSRAADFTAYKVLEHRHEPEILMALGSDFTSKNSILFVPHLIPVPRGIFVSAYLTFDSEVAARNLPALYRDFYSHSPFIRFRERPPRLVDVVGTNFCDIQVVPRGKSAVVMTTSDNLGKGMAGQCIQNLNLMFGLPETNGLLFPALGPV